MIFRINITTHFFKALVFYSAVYSSWHKPHALIWAWTHLPQMRNVLGCHTRVSTQSTTCHCSQANEYELWWRWRKCGDFGLYNSIVIQSQIGTLKKYEQPIHYYRGLHWLKTSAIRNENVEDRRRRTLIVTSQSLWRHDRVRSLHHSNAVNESTATEWLNNGEKDKRIWTNAIRSI